VSSSRDERGRQKLLERETAEQTKQVKPVGVVQSAEPFPARDNGKSDVGTWEAVFARENMLSALKRVESNKGAAGIDGMKVPDLRGYLKEHWLEVREALESGKYRPSPVRRVEIPKPDGGGARQLGIPTVLDRLIQQAIAQVLSPMFEQVFSPYSYGFRPGRSAHQAIQKSQEYIREGYDWCVDIDLEKFFDRVNHDMLMARVARVVKDKRVLKLIRAYLNSGVMVNGVVMDTEEGTPQGGPLSPLLSNVMLNDLDRELEERGHKFVRYADDCNIYVKTQTGVGKCEALSGKEVEVESQPEEEQGRTSDAGEISRVQFLEAQGRSVHPNCEPHKGTLDGEDTTPDETDTHGQAGRYCGPNQSICDWLDGLLSTGQHAECVQGTGRMDQTETTTDVVETLETGNNALSGTDEAWSTERTSGAWSRRHQSLAHVPNPCDTRSSEQRLLA
jgi:group II intron reverse transcriptase/maturase